jgi:hypothetical protein
MSIAYSECVSVVLGIEHEMRAFAILSSVACMALLYFSTLSHKQHGFRKKKLLNMKCVWISLQLLPESFLVIRRTERDMMKSVYCSLCEVPVIIVRFLLNLNFLYRFSKYTQIWNLMKIRPVGAQLFHAYRRTDRHDESNSLFSQFFEGP